MSLHVAKPRKGRGRSCSPRGDPESLDNDSGHQPLYPPCVSAVGLTLHTRDFNESKEPYCQGKHTDLNLPLWPGTTVTICVSYFRTGGPGREGGTNKPPPTGRVPERSKGDSVCPSTSQNPPRWRPSWLSIACTARRRPESEGLARENPETNPVTIKPRTASHVAEQFSWAPSAPCSPL